MDRVIIGSAVRMSQYVNESCFKYRSMVKIELIGTEGGSVTEGSGVLHEVNSLPAFPKYGADRF